ncbi:MAG: helix-turn-helix transcriptional regulator [Armatimonadota bacterium]
MQKSVYSPEQLILQEYLRKIRQDAGLTQAELAERLGKPQPFVSRYEVGEKMLDLPELRQVCHALGISMVEFIQRYERALTEKGM